MSQPEALLDNFFYGTTALVGSLAFFSFLYQKGGGDGAGGSKKSLCRIWHRKGHYTVKSRQCGQTLSLETCPVCRSRR